jgi:MYXO-CTERM domain-containing protein
MSARSLAVAAWLCSSVATAAPLTVNAGNSPFTVTTGSNDTWDSVEVQSGGVLLVNGPIHVTTGDFIVRSGGIVRTALGTQLVTIDAPGRLVDVQFGGLIDLTGFGLLGGLQPGNGSCSGQTHNPVTFFVEVGGGQFAGGSGPARGGGNSAAVYGSPTSPPLRGGGGGCGDYSRVGSNGGGALRIDAATLRVDGTIQANGADSTATGYTAGAGAGGSITVNITTFTGNGALLALGGNASGYGGAGGRINIALTTWSFTGTVASWPGSGGSGSGGLGSVFARSTSNTQYVTNGFTDLGAADAIDRVLFRGGGELRLSGPAAVTNTLIVPSGNTLVLNSGTALAGLTLFDTLDGSLVVNVPFTRTGNLVLNAALTLNNELTVTGNLTLSPTGTASHAPVNRFAAVVVGGTFNVQGTMNFSGLGCGNTQVWDTLTRTCVGGGGQYAGGSYGGRGGGNSAASYGTLDAPQELGSGGAYGDYSRAGSNGGGLIRITAGTLIVDGAILNNGVDNTPTGYSAGGGSGGGIRIDATTVSGGGLIRALGGPASGGGGAGGRISINYTTWSFAGQITASGGSGSVAGAQGTVRLKSAANVLTVLNGRYDLGSAHSYASVLLTGNAWLTLSGTPTVTAMIQIPAGNKLSLNSSSALTNATISNNIEGTLEINAPFTLGAQTVPGTLIVNADSTLGNVTATGTIELNATLNVPNLTLNAPARMTHAAGNALSSLNATGTVLVGNLASIDLDIKGLGPSTTYNPITLSVANWGGQYCGGTNGGLGWGNSSPQYGTAEQPIYLGSGGCFGDYSRQGHPGGGRMRIVANTFRLDGTFSARGGDSNPTGYSAGGGSGGSTWITAQTFTGVGNFYFTGGPASGGGGGGGRVSIDFAANTFTGSINTAGGVGGSGTGAQGTVRVQTLGANPDLVVQAGDYHVTGGQTYNSVTLKPGAVLHFDGPATVVQPLVIPTSTTVWLNTTTSLDNIALPSRIDGTLVANAPLTLTQPRQLGGTLWNRQPVTMPQSLEVLPNGGLRVDDVLSINGDLTLANGVNVTHTAGVRKFDLRASGRLLVPLGASIQADGLGFPGGNTGAFGCNGTTHDPVTQNPMAGSGQRGGGGFGGLGGAPSNAVYGAPGSVEYPGSGGGCGDYSRVGAPGAGLLRVTASVLELYGHIRAVGGSSTATGYSAGAGSGGGIHITAAAMLGNGLVRANGGAGSGGGGGGGRILLDLGNNVFTGTIEALGGAGSPVGAVGTISTPTNTSPPVITSVPATVARVNTAWSYDSDGLPAAAGAAPLTWSLVSGPPQATVNPSTGAFTWTPTSLGRVNFVLRVGNINGNSDQSFSVDVLAPPVVTSSAAGTGSLGNPYHYSASDSLTVQGSAPFTYLATVAPPGAPSFDVDQTGRITWTPNSQGTFGPCVRVSNPVGSTDHCFTVTVSGAITPPTITSAPPLSGAVGLPYSYQVLASGTAPITFAFLTGASPQGATISANGGQVQWTPTSVGTPYFCVRATNQGGTDTQCWDVTVLSAPASPQFTSSCSVLASVGAPYHYDADDTVDVTGSAPMTFTLVSPPAGMAIDAGGRLTWTPAQQGAVAFGVRADNSAGSATQNCLVTVRSGQPLVGAPLIWRTANPLAAVGIDYLVSAGGALNVDGQRPIAWSKTAGPSSFRVDATTGAVAWKPTAAGVQTITLRASNSAGEDNYTFDVDVKPAAPSGPKAGIKGPDGTLTGAAPFVVDADGSDSTSSAKILSWTWNWGDGSADAQGQTASHTYTGCGGYVLRLTVTDEYGQSNTDEQLVAVTCNGLTPPIARIVMPVRTGQGQLNANFSAEIVAGSGTINGQQWLSTDGFSSDLAADTHVFEPGGHTLQLIVVDSNGLTAIDRVQITVSDAAGNEPPRVIAWATPPAGAAPLAVTFGYSAVDPDGAIASAAWRFLDGSTSSDVAPVKTYTEAAFDRVVFEVADDKGLKASALVEVNVGSVSGDSAPEILSTPRASIFAGQLYTYDKDGLPSVRGAGPFTWALTTAPEGATVDAATGKLEWTPAAGSSGQSDFTLEVTGKAGKASQSWKVEVVSLGETSNPPAQGCTCASVDGSWVWMLLLLGGALSRRRRGSP